MTALADVVAAALAEDLGPLGDITSALLDPAHRGHGRFVARQAGVLAGRACADEAFRQVDGAIRADWRTADGDAVDAGQVIGEIDGPMASLLTAERTALNFMCHLSGVATITRHYVDAVKGTNVRVLDTRKTTPGLRTLEKAAVRAGGGHNHRGSLSDMVLIKDNHLVDWRVADAVDRARERWPGRGVEVECDRLEQVREAVAAGADIVMLDNMRPGDVAVCVKEVDSRALVEVSGGVTLATIAEYAAAGPDLISVGALTHSAPILDIGLDF
ncbi:MAG: carboxylating nicotinate-nucleotide diphosphorylase [Actinobacteria bacterium]|nr:carboxylating nicotinate-nucleotide diphosphorylase [Actinomycetota bacterium]